VAHPPVGVPLRLLLDLAHNARGVVTRHILDLLEQDLLRLGRGQAGDALELANVLALALVEDLDLPVELALPVAERSLALGQLGELDIDRLLLGYDALLDAGDFAAPFDQLVLDLVAGDRRRR